MRKRITTQKSQPLLKILVALTVAAIFFGAVVLGLSLLYPSRVYPNKVFNQTDWSGGGGVEGPVSEPQNTFASSTDIDYTSEQGSIKIKF